MNRHEMSLILQDVRKAYRLLADYQLKLERSIILTICIIILTRDTYITNFTRVMKISAEASYR